MDFIKSPPFRRIDSGTVPASDENESEYEEGTVSGYAVQHAMPSGFVRPRPENHQYAANSNENNNQPEQQYANTYLQEPQYAQHYPQNPQPVHNYQQEPQYVNYQHDQEAAAPPLQTQTIAGNKAGLPSFAELFDRFWTLYLPDKISKFKIDIDYFSSICRSIIQSN